MTFNFHCQNCREDLEFDYESLSENSKGLKCESCGKRLSASELEEFMGAVDELLAQLAGLRKRFLVAFDVDAEDLPEQFADGARRGDDEEDDEEADEADDDEDEDAEEDDDEESADDDY